MTYQSSLHDSQNAYAYSRVRRQIFGEFPIMVRTSGTANMGERLNTAAFAVQEEARKATVTAAGPLADLCAELKGAYDAGHTVEVSAGKGKLGMWVVCMNINGLRYHVKGLTKDNAAYVVGAIRRTFAGLPVEVTA
jgi:hypothetical protein